MGRKRIVLTDLAREVGVSSCTVSKALRGLHGVSPGIRTKVQRVAERLNYVPNHHAQSLSSGRTNLVGLVTPPIILMTPQEDALGRLEMLARADGKRLVRVDYDRDECSTLLNIALEQHWQGMFLFPNAPDAEIAKLARALNEFEIPLVTAGCGPLDVDGVMRDLAHGIRLLLDHAHAQGMRRVCIITWVGEAQDLPHSEKFKSLEADLRYRGMELVAAIGYEDLVSHGPAVYRTAYEAFESALERGLDVDLVIGANDVIAIAAMNCLLNHGRRVPDDVAVSGYDDTEYALYSRPPLTTIASPREEIAELGWGMLRRRLNGESGAPRAVTVLPTLIVRESTGVAQMSVGVLKEAEGN